MFLNLAEFLSTELIHKKFSAIKLSWWLIGQNKEDKENVNSLLLCYLLFYQNIFFFLRISFIKWNTLL